MLHPVDPVIRIRHAPPLRYLLAMAVLVTVAIVGLALASSSATGLGYTVDERVADTRLTAQDAAAIAIARMNEVAAARSSGVPSHVRLGTLGLAAIALVVGVAVSALVQGPRADSEFWRSVYFEGVMAENYDSLADMTRAADAVVVGKINSLEKSRSWVADPDLGDDGIAFYAKASVSVENVLAGKFVAGPQGDLGLEIFLPNWRKFDEMAASPPAGRLVLFLRRQPDTAEPLYRIVNVAEGYFREGPQVEPPEGASDPWLEELHGIPFADLVAKIQSLRP